MFRKAVEIGSSPSVGLFMLAADMKRKVSKKRKRTRKRKSLVKPEIVYRNVKERGQM